MQSITNKLLMIFHESQDENWVDMNWRGKSGHANAISEIMYSSGFQTVGRDPLVGHTVRKGGSHKGT